MSTMQSQMGRAPAGSVAGWVLSVDMNGIIVNCSELLARVCGRDSAELLGVSIGKLLPQLAVDGKTSRQKVAAMIDYEIGRGHV